MGGVLWAVKVDGVRELDPGARAWDEHAGVGYDGCVGARDYGGASYEEVSQPRRTLEGEITEAARVRFPDFAIGKGNSQGSEAEKSSALKVEFPRGKCWVGGFRFR